MEPAFRFADRFGPDKVVYLRESGADLQAIVVIDNVACGPAIGGVRMAPDVSAEECFRLARAMTLKNVAAGLSHGGAKSVIFADPRQDLVAKERLMRAFACAMRALTDYIPGPDMGTDERCMAWIRDEIGRAVGLPAEIGGIPLDEVGATGFGVAIAAEVAEAFGGVALKGARIAIQGFGSVGRHVALRLVERGAILVAAADSRAAVWDGAGLNLRKLLEIKASGGGLRDYPGGEKGPPDAIVDVPCDIWIPAARPDVIRADNVGRLKARLVIEGANIPVTAEAEELLHRRNVLCIPDFIANAGGVICAAIEYRGGTRTLAFQTIEEKIRANTASVLQAAIQTAVPPRRAALDLAEQRLAKAMALRRWHKSGLPAEGQTPPARMTSKAE
jgi:glutamate dehydrogenase (NAD(P)+)